MKSSKLLFLIFVLLYSSFYAQVQWPFPNPNVQATVTGTMGEARNSGARFHKGTDLINGGNRRIHSLNTGEVTYQNVSNWSPRSSRIQVGNVMYIHCRPSDVFITSPRPINVNPGDHIGDMIPWITEDGANVTHLHLQENGTNYLRFLNPYVDNHPPEVIRANNRFPDGYKLYRNGIRNNSSTGTQNNLEITDVIRLDSQEFKPIFGKIDISADIRDRRTGPNGGSAGGNTAPFAYTYQLQNYDQPNQDNPLYEYELGFWNVPNNNAANAVFHPQSLGNGTRSTHIITSDHRNTPFDRFFRTNIRVAIDENWLLDNESEARRNARNMQEAAFPDNKYRLYIDAYDIERNDNPNQSLANVIDIPVIIDNFLPYVKDVEVTNSDRSFTYYKKGWRFNRSTGIVAQNANGENEEISTNELIKIRVYPSEPLSTLNVVVNNSTYRMDKGFSQTATGRVEYWETDLLSIDTPGTRQLTFSGEDIAGNNLRVNPTEPIFKLDNGEWPDDNAAITGEDTWHRIKIVTPDTTIFDADFNEGAFCSPNRRHDILTKRTDEDCLTVCFQDNSTPHEDIVSWNWEFGDFNNSTSNSKAPSFTYPGAGIYEVSLTVTNNQNQTREVSKLITVEECTNEINAAISASVTSGEAPFVVNFFDNSTGTIARRKWNIPTSIQNRVEYLSGNSSSQNPIVSFGVAGAYPINLTLEDDSGAEITSNTIIINVSSSSSVGLDVDFTIQGQPFTGNHLGFISQISDGCNQFDYQWTFNDYNGARNHFTPDVTYVFPVPGNYTVELCVTDNCGNRACKTKPITITNFVSSVTAKISTTIEDRNYIVKKGEEITFRDVSTPNDIILYGSWFWDYKEGVDGPDHFYWYPRPNVVKHTYDKVGTYKVRLYVGENRTHFGDYEEIEVTVVDDFDYLEIPTIHESHRQVIEKGKRLNMLPTKNFGDYMISETYIYDDNPIGNARIEIQFYKKQGKNWIFESTFPTREIQLIDKKITLDRSSIKGYGDKIIAKGIILGETGAFNDIFIFKKNGPTWDNPILLQEILGTSDHFRYGEEIYDYEIFGNALAIYRDKKISRSPLKTIRFVEMYEFDNNTNQYEYNGSLIPSDPYFEGNHQIFGDTKNLVSHKDVLMLSNEKPASPFAGGIYLYEKPQEGWLNGTENTRISSVTNPIRNGFTKAKAYALQENAMLIGEWSSGSFLGFSMLEKNNDTWKIEQGHTFTNYRDNIDDYSGNGTVRPRLMSNPIFGDSGDFILANGGHTRDYSYPLALFYKSNKGWTSKLKEDFRLYPQSFKPDEVRNREFMENQGEVTTLAITDYGGRNNPKMQTTIYTYDLNQPLPDDPRICNRLVNVDDKVINEVQPGAEGKAINISNTTVNSSGGVTYKAIDAVTIKPGTIIKKGGYFNAVVTDCNQIDQ